MDVYTTLNKLTEIIEKSKNVPLSSKKMIDADEVLSIIDDLANNVPEEVKQGKLVLEREKYILDDAKRNANAIMDEAEEHAKNLVEESEIVAAANERADEIVEEANINAKEVREGALNYAIEILQKLEEKIQIQHDTVKQNLREFDIN